MIHRRKVETKDAKRIRLMKNFEKFKTLIAEGWSVNAAAAKAGWKIHERLWLQTVEPEVDAAVKFYFEIVHWKKGAFRWRKSA